jgi:ApbE superfamily uncharacterized protein (UPF0280 family)
LNPGQERTYRRWVEPRGLVAFRVSVKETDLLLAAGADLGQEARSSVLSHRRFLESWIQQSPDFLTALTPIPHEPEEELAPLIVREMLIAGRAAGTGPMAAVAGAMAGRVGQDLLEHSTEIIIENGGDLFLAAARELKIGLFAGSSPLSGRLRLVIHAASQPLGVSTSSGSFGHSLSLGKADAATVAADTPALADALATALGNRVKTKADIEPALEWLAGRPGARGGLIIIGRELGAWGELELDEK